MQEKLLKQDEFWAKVEPGRVERVSSSGRRIRHFAFCPTTSNTVVVQQKQRDGTYNEKSCPKAMADYSKFMGGVDAANQLRLYYERDRRNKKWWIRPF
jgi:hypothetical protein